VIRWCNLAKKIQNLFLKSGFPDASVVEGSNQFPYAVHNQKTYDQTDDRSSPVHRSPFYHPDIRYDRASISLPD
jgi:hypothetical protein